MFSCKHARVEAQGQLFPGILLSRRSYLLGRLHDPVAVSLGTPTQALWAAKDTLPRPAPASAPLPGQPAGGASGTQDQAPMTVFIGATSSSPVELRGAALPPRRAEAGQRDLLLLSLHRELHTEPGLPLRPSRLLPLPVSMGDLGWSAPSQGRGEISQSHPLNGPQWRLWARPWTPRVSSARPAAALRLPGMCALAAVPGDRGLLASTPPGLRPAGGCTLPGPRTSSPRPRSGRHSGTSSSR